MSLLPEQISFYECYFGEIKDFRSSRGKRHYLSDIFTITILAVLSGADDWVGVAEYGKDKERFLQQYLKLPHGVASHDTFNTIFKLLNPMEFENCFVNWMRHICQFYEGEIIAIDGKQLRSSYDKADNKAAIHMVSAWANTNHMVIGQVKVDSKSNEITAIPKLLDALDVQDCTITIDAMGTQKEIAAKIIDKKADYILALKENHKFFYGEVVSFFDNFKGTSLISSHSIQSNKGHGRKELRICHVITDMNLFPDASLWKAIKSIIMIQSSRKVKEKTAIQNRYYISSLQGNAKKINDAIRQHWAVENKLHWSLDVAFKEDLNRIRKGNGAQNFSIIRRICLNLLKLETSTKVGLQNKRLKAARSDKYLFKVLQGFNQ